MRHMQEHAIDLNWAARWLQRLWRLCFGLSILFAVGTVLILLFGRFDPAAGLNSDTLRFLNVANGISLAIGLLITGFMFRVACIICDFLSDFASGLYAQQIQRERRMSEVNKS